MSLVQTFNNWILPFMSFSLVVFSYTVIPFKSGNRNGLPMRRSEKKRKEKGNKNEVCLTPTKNRRQFDEEGVLKYPQIRATLATPNTMNVDKPKLLTHCQKTVNNKRVVAVRLYCTVRLVLSELRFLRLNIVMTLTTEMISKQTCKYLC